ncbi:hypothetical protein GCM10010406_11070 [Streptomyces thermolineatus]|uniref:SpdB n=2 Tax=Streptomyces TaxID=1883 RepID=A0ABP5YBM1_9ACTN
MSIGTWLIVAGAMLYSVLTVTPLMRAHTPDAWDWTAPILPIVVDAAVVIVVRLDSVLARLGGKGGPWPVALRWMTGVMTLALNVADSALTGDLVGVAVHAVAPLLLIVTAETSLAYRQAITAAVAALAEQEAAERAAREHAAAERARLAREEREAAREAAERRAREEREHAARLERERDERERERAREEREHAERMRREEWERAERQAAERAERERQREEREREQRRREQQQHEHEQRERQRHEREREQAERERRERAEREAAERAALLALGPAEEKRSEDLALRIVRAAFTEGLPVRGAAELTGWSLGWVSARYQDLRDAHTPTAPRVLEEAAA